MMGRGASKKFLGDGHELKKMHDLKMKQLRWQSETETCQVEHLNTVNESRKREIENKRRKIEELKKKQGSNEYEIKDHVQSGKQGQD